MQGYLALVFFVLLIQVVASYPNDVPALDVLPVKGDSPPMVNIKIGYPRKYYMKMALDLNYETSWLFATRKCKTSKCTQQCYQTDQSETLTNYTLKKQRKESQWNFFGKDLVTLRNGREYHMSFGLTETQCVNKHWPYSGVLSVAPQNAQFSRDFLSQFNLRMVSFFLPSARSRMQQGTLVFGTQMHPGCSYKGGFGRAIRFIENDRWRFQVGKVEVRGGPAKTFTNHQAHNIWLATDVEGFYVPEQYAQAIYKAFNVTLESNSDQYYKKCAQIDSENNSVDLFIDGTVYRMEEKYLFTPISKNSCRLNVHIGDSSTNNWILGKKFMEHYCVTINYVNYSLHFGLVSEKPTV